MKVKGYYMWDNDKKELICQTGNTTEVSGNQPKPPVTPIKYELYEDNEGGLYLYILGEDGEAKALYIGWEYAPEPGIMLEVVSALERGIDSEIIYKAWWDIKPEYEKSCLDHELIAYNGWAQRGALMGSAGRRAFGYPEW